MNPTNPTLNQRGFLRKDTPVTPLPPIVGTPDTGVQQPAYPGNEADTPVTPLPPIVGTPDTGVQQPAYPGDGADIPVTPLPPIVGTPDTGVQQPAYPGDGADIPVIPLPPIVGTPDTGVNQRPTVFPNCPICSAGYCTVRFLHAAYSYEPLRVVISSRQVVNSLSFAGMSRYSRISDGFRTVTITTASSPRTIMYQRNIPFHSGEVITMAIVRTASGIDLVRISDVPCSNRPQGRACIRTANLVYNSPALDVILNDGRVVFSDVRFKEVTAFKQARPQEYGFYIAQTPYALSTSMTDIETMEDMPIVLANYYLPGYGTVDPLVSFFVDAKANGMYTIYLLGGWSSNPTIRTKVVEDF